MVFTRDFLLIISEDVVIGDVVDVDSQLYELFELFGISISFSACGGSENTSSFKLISFELIPIKIIIIVIKSSYNQVKLYSKI